MVSWHLAVCLFKVKIIFCSILDDLIYLKCYVVKSEAQVSLMALMVSPSAYQDSGTGTPK